MVNEKGDVSLCPTSTQESLTEQSHLQLTPEPLQRRKVSVSYSTCKPRLFVLTYRLPIALASQIALAVISIRITANETFPSKSQFQGFEQGAPVERRVSFSNVWGKARTLTTSWTNLNKSGTPVVLDQKLPDIQAPDDIKLEPTKWVAYPLPHTATELCWEQDPNNGLRLTMYKHQRRMVSILSSQLLDTLCRHVRSSIPGRLWLVPAAIIFGNVVKFIAPYERLPE